MSTNSHTWRKKRSNRYPSDLRWLARKPLNTVVAASDDDDDDDDDDDKFKY